MQLRQPFSGYYAISLDFGETYPGLYDEKHPHKGIDYLTPEGTPILAAADGRVLTIGWEPNGYGHYIVILHSDLSGTVYAHLSKINVIFNTMVSKGDVIGYSGNSGNTTGAHLHFEYRSEAAKPGTAKDPKPYMQSVIDTPAQAEITPETNPQININIYGRPYSQRHEQMIDGGLCQVVCDIANIRDVDTFAVCGQLYRGAKAVVSPDVVWYNNLPYHHIFDDYMLIAEYDGYGTEILKQIDL